MNQEQYKAHRARQKRQSVIYDTGQGPLRLSSLTSSWNVSDIKEMLYDKQNGLCALCRHDVDLLQSLDHRLPLARGGTDELKNLQLVHRDCNQKKQARTQEEWEVWLLKNPDWISKYAMPEDPGEHEAFKDDLDTDISDASQGLDIDFNNDATRNQIQVEAEAVALETEVKTVKLKKEQELQKLNNEVDRTENIRLQAEEKLEILKFRSERLQYTLNMLQQRDKRNRIAAEAIRAISVAEIARRESSIHIAEGIRIQFISYAIKLGLDEELLVNSILLRAKHIKLQMAPVPQQIHTYAMKFKCLNCGYSTKKILPRYKRYCADCRV